MASRILIFHPIESSKQKPITISGKQFCYYQCDGIERQCLIQTGLLSTKLDETVLIDRQIKILSDILSKVDYENWVTCYYFNNWEPFKPGPNKYDYVDVDSIHIPKNHFEKIDCSLMNIYRIFGEGIITFDEPFDYMSIYAKDSDEGEAMIRSLVDFGYLSGSEFDTSLVISKEGWKHIYEMEKQETDRTGFIAISFSDESARILEVLKEGIKRAGFNPIVIKDEEHNNQIVPEIRKYIKRCRFLVMDCSYPNYGAYYEAGIAAGEGKEVIICCRKDSFDSKDTRPHFDIAQQSMIIWEDETDLIERLVRRIEATVVEKQLFGGIKQ